MPEPQPTARRDRAVLAAIIGAILAPIVGAGITYILRDREPQPVQLTITNPQNGGSVKFREDIRIGLSGTLQPGQELWSVVDSLTEGRRYPQGACQLLSKTEASCTVRLGKQSQESVGRSYIITVILIKSTDVPILTPLKDSGYPTAGPVQVSPLAQSQAITVKRI